MINLNKDSNDVTIFSCDPDTQMTGPEIRVCQHNAIWTGTTTYCESSKNCRSSISWELGSIPSVQSWIVKRNGQDTSWRQCCNLLAIRDVTSIANMLTVFAIFCILLYFSHSNSNFEAYLVLLYYIHAYATTNYLR